MTVVETPFFLRKASALLHEEARSELVRFLGINPESGKIIPEREGPQAALSCARERKARWRTGDLLLPQ